MYWGKNTAACWWIGEPSAAPIVTSWELPDNYILTRWVWNLVALFVPKKVAALHSMHVTQPSTKAIDYTQQNRTQPSRSLPNISTIA